MEVVERCANITSPSCDVTHLRIDLAETYELQLVGSRGNATLVRCFGSIFPELDSELVSVCRLHTATKGIAVSGPGGREVCRGASESGPVRALGLPPWPGPSAPPSLGFPVQNLGRSPGLFDDCRCPWKADVQALAPAAGRFVFQPVRERGAGLRGLVSERPPGSGPVFSSELQPFPEAAPGSRLPRAGAGLPEVCSPGAVPPSPFRRLESAARPVSVALSWAPSLSRCPNLQAVAMRKGQF